MEAPQQYAGSAPTLFLNWDGRNAPESLTDSFALAQRCHFSPLRPLLTPPKRLFRFSKFPRENERVCE